MREPGINAQSARPLSKPIVWTIGGSDSGGGAGVQADLATFRDLGVYGCSVITTVTAQNTRALNDALPLPATSVSAQMETLLSDLPPVAIKIGALGSHENVDAVLAFLAKVDAFVVWDPVSEASVGGALGPVLDHQQLCALLWRADVVTPNADEAASWHLHKDPVAAAQALIHQGASAVMIKGGHTDEPALDYWQLPEHGFWLDGERITGTVGHGGGCTLASAIAAAHALGVDRYELPVVAKAYLTRGLRLPEPVGRGRSPVGHHGAAITLRDLPRVHDRRPWQTLRFAPIDQPLGLYVIADSAEWVRQLAALDVPTIQLRIKDAPEAELEREIAAAVAAVSGTRSRLFINDHWQLAIARSAYGVHLGQEDLDQADLRAIADAGIRLGISCHSEYEIARAHALEPSYVALGPIYATTIKRMKFEPQGLKRLTRWAALLRDRYPLVAIGGIDASRAAGVMQCGVHSICVIRAVRDATDPAAAVAQLRAAITAAANGGTTAVDALIEG